MLNIKKNSLKNAIMKKLFLAFYFTILCSIFAQASGIPPVYVRNTIYPVGSLVSETINGNIYVFSCETAQNQYYSVDPSTPNNYQWSVYYQGAPLPWLQNGYYKSSSLITVSVIINGSTYLFDCISNNVVDPRLSSNSWAWKSETTPSPVLTPLTGFSQWQTGTNYEANNPVWQYVNGTIYYFSCLNYNINQDPSISPSTNWTVANVNISPALPYNSTLHYSIIGMTTVFNNLTYILNSNAPSQGQNGLAPSSSSWSIKGANASTTSCFSSINCNAIPGTDGTTYSKSYTSGGPSSFYLTGLNYYDPSHQTSGQAMMVSLGETRNPISPLIMNNNDILLRDANDIYHGLGYYGSSGNVNDATTPQKRNFADTPIDGPVLYGWSGGAMGLRQRNNVNNVTSPTVEKVALRWDWSNVYIGSPIVSGKYSLNQNLVVYGGATFGTTTTPSALTVNGTIGIGTTNVATLTAYKLAVNGAVVATSMDINGTVPASDYVFEKDYKLRTLAETEVYVNKNKHLPEVPSAEEFKQNGYNVGKMDDILLRKVEELTLYMIEMQKQNEALKAKIESLEKTIR
jgi:6,7-dimethyl-8-ribityllumazine synthase